VSYVLESELVFLESQLVTSEFYCTSEPFMFLKWIGSLKLWHEADQPPRLVVTPHGILQLGMHNCLHTP